MHEAWINIHVCLSELSVFQGCDGALVAHGPNVFDVADDCAGCARDVAVWGVTTCTSRLCTVRFEKSETPATFSSAQGMTSDLNRRPRRRFLPSPTKPTQAGSARCCMQTEKQFPGSRVCACATRWATRRATRWRGATSGRPCRKTPKVRAWRI